MATSGWLFRLHQSSSRSSSSVRPVLEALVYKFQFLVRPMLAGAALGILPTSRMPRGKTGLLCGWSDVLLVMTLLVRLSMDLVPPGWVARPARQALIVAASLVWGYRHVVDSCKASCAGRGVFSG